MKGKFCFLLAAVLFLCGCSRSDWGRPSLPWETEPEHTEIWDPEATRPLSWEELNPETQPSADQIVRQQLAPYLDVSRYEDDQYTGPVLPEAVREIRVHGVLLRIGMAYDEIIAAGFTPALEDLAQSETEGMLVSFDFSAPNGKTVRLALWGPMGTTYGESTLRSVRLEEEDMDFHVEGIGENATLDMILTALGEPTRLRINASHAGSNVVLEYRFADDRGCLQFVIDPEDGSLIHVDLWGET